MTHVVYALFDDASRADRVRAQFSRHGPGQPGYDVQPHHGHLDANQLPEAATSYGRNLIVGTLAGTGFFLVLGVIVGATGTVTSIGMGMGAVMGIVSGVVIGVFTGMQAGTRSAKPPLLALAPRIAQGAVLLTIEVDRRGDANQLIEQLDEYDAEVTGVC